VRQLTESGSQLGFPAEVSTRVAEKVKLLYPHIELLRFSSTGSEAIATALRLARTFTGRRCVIAFEGHYHGSSGFSIATTRRSRAFPTDPTDRLFPERSG
jgi:glutamate-1-semialdehyde 2,1-aminomutase